MKRQLSLLIRKQHSWLATTQLLQQARSAAVLDIAATASAQIRPSEILILEELPNWANTGLHCENSAKDISPPAQADTPTFALRPHAID